jgi:hypothetical protein
LKFVFILLDIGLAPRNFLLNPLNFFSKFEGIPSWIWLPFFGAWFQLFGLFWMVTGLLIFRPLPVLMKLNTESALLDYRHVAGTVSKFLNKNGFGEGNDSNQGRRVFLFY